MSMTFATNVIGQKGINNLLTGTGVVGQDGSSSAAYIPSLWTFNAGMTPAAGDIITVKIPCAGKNAGVWVSVDNGTTYYPIAITADTRFTTHFAANYLLTLVFETGLNIKLYGNTTSGGAAGASLTSYQLSRWKVLNYYDTGNTNDTGTLVRDYGGNVAYVTADSTVYRYQLLFPTIQTNYGWKFIAANTTSNSTATSKTTIFTTEFNPFEPILYYSHTDTVSSGATIRADRIWKMYPITLTYSFNCGSTLTASKDVYIVAYLTGQSSAKLRNPGATGTNAAATATGSSAGPITQTLPTTDDGFIYIKLGRAYSSNAVDVSMDHPVYWYKDGAIRICTGELPYVTSSDNGKFLLVENGSWVARSVPNANGNSF